MPICKFNGCNNVTVTKPLCHQHAVTLANRRTAAKGKGKLCTEQRKRWIKTRQANIDLDRQLRGLPKDKVPIAKVKWLERPMP